MATKQNPQDKGTVREGLTDQQIRFANEYARTLNQREAYYRAGYKASTEASCAAQSSTLLKNPKIKAYLQEVAGLSEVSVANAVTAIAFCPITEVLRWDGESVTMRHTDHWTERAKLAVKRIKVTKRVKYTEDGNSEVTLEHEVELYDRLQAIEKLMKKMRMYPTGKQMDELEWIAEGVRLGLAPQTITEVAIDNVDAFKGQIRKAFAGVLPERTADVIDQAETIAFIKAQALGLDPENLDGLSEEVDS